MISKDKEFIKLTQKVLTDYFLELKKDNPNKAKLILLEITLKGLRDLKTK